MENEFDALKETGEVVKIYGNKLIDFKDLNEMLILFGINLLALFIVVRLIYYSIHREKEYVFAYTVSNIAIFFLCILLANVKLKLGFAFGLFAVLSIVRFRTEAIPIKEMTYFFIIIIIAVINSLSSKSVSYAELLVTNSSIILAIFYLEKAWLKKQDSSRTIVYEKIELIMPGKRKELIADLKERTGLEINKVKIGNVNFLNDTALVEVFYNEATQEK